MYVHIHSLNYSFLWFIGLWYYPSFINHSCWDSNCYWNVYNGVMFVRAFRDIAAGNEILISYSKLIRTTYSLKVECLSVYDFECTCNLCLLDKSGPQSAHKEHNRLFEEFQELTTPEEMLNNIEAVKSCFGNRLSQSCALYIAYPFLQLG